MDVRIRPISIRDCHGLVEFYSQLSGDSRRTRFLGTGTGVTRTAAAILCRPNHAHEKGLVAVATDGIGPPSIVGHVCMLRTAAKSSELGIAVADAYQGHGIGRRLYRAALEWARDNGIETLTASAFADNSRVLALLTGGCSATVTPAGAGTVEIKIDIGTLPTDFSRATRRPRGAWRRMPPPARDAAGSALTGSSSRSS